MASGGPILGGAPPASRAAGTLSAYGAPPRVPTFPDQVPLPGQRSRPGKSWWALPEGDGLVWRKLRAGRELYTAGDNHLCVSLG